MRKRLLQALTHRWVVTGFLSACLLGGMGHMSFGCSGWDPTRPFERNNPDVDRALEMLDNGQYENAEELLGDYLDTGTCDKGKIGLPDDLRNKSDGTFDLGLVLFHLAEKYGERFGDEKKLLEKIDAGEDLAQLQETYDKRSDEVKCALIIALAIAKDSRVPTDLRARAFYLAGNLEFLRLDYKKAIKGYEEALRLIPGIVEEAGGDGIGRDAAWNRAVALRRLEEMLQDAGADAGDDGDAPEDADGGNGPQEPDGGEPTSPDGGENGGNGDAGDAGPDAGEDSGLGDNADAGQDGGDNGEDGGNPQSEGPDAGDKDPKDGTDDQEPQDSEPEPAEPKDSGPSAPDQGDRVLDQFDETPTYQQEEAKKKADLRKRNMEDK